MPAERMQEILTKAKAERATGKIVNIATMKKNKKVQKEQMEAEGYTVFEEFYINKLNWELEILKEIEQWQSQ